MQITIHQRTTTFIQFLIRCVGVIGGIFVCSGYAIRITTRAVESISGADRQQGIVAAEATGVQSRRKWHGGELRSRNQSIGKVVRQGNSWVVEGNSPYGSYAGTPVSGAFAATPAGSPYPPLPPSYPNSPYPAPPSAAPGPSFGLGLGPNSAFGPAPSPRPGMGGFPGSPYLPHSPAGYAHFPPTPNPEATVFPRSPPPPLAKGHSGGGSISGLPKKDD